MRQLLLRLWFDQPWSLWTYGPDGMPQLGAAWAWIILVAAYLLYFAIRRQWSMFRDPMTWLPLGVILLLISLQPVHGLLPSFMPVFGYGIMVLLGFAGGVLFATQRAKAAGYDPELVLDAGFVILLTGVLGGRLAYLLQYHQQMFDVGTTLPQALFKIVNLSEGGLVLIGGLVLGTIGFIGFCKVRRIPVFDFADVLIPAAFIGIGFGRIGCLLNGCCFGDRCDLPWAITFPQGSVTFQTLMHRGFVDPEALATFPLHPTQIYSSINGFLLAFVTATYFWYRRYPGDVFALACILYPISRFLIEFIRADEMGQLNTGLTISQLYSIGIFTFGIALLAAGPLRAKWTAKVLETRTVSGTRPAAE